MIYKNYACINFECEMYEKYGEKNIGRHSRYGKEKDRELLYCKKCMKTFSAENRTLFKDIRLPKRIVYDVLQNLCSGAGVRGTARNVGVHRDTVTKLKRCAAEHFEEVNKILLKEIKVTEIQMDEFWSFVKKKKSVQQKKRKNKV